MFTEAKDDGGGGDNWTTGAISRATLLACLGFNGTFSINRLYRAITVGKCHVGAGDNTNT